MFASLRVFSVREPYSDPYRVPVLDVGGALVPPTASPEILTVGGGVMTWTAVPGATSYRIEQLAAGNRWETLGTSSTTEFSDAQVSLPGFYRVVGVNALGSGPHSPVIRVLDLLASNVEVLASDTVVVASATTIY